MRPDFRPPSGPLGELTAASHARAALLASRRATLRARAEATPAGPSFRQALQQGTVAVIAELKRRSPSKGVLDDTLSAAARGGQYEAGGAAALSILTEPTRFGGTLDDLQQVGAAVGIPRLRKDFIVDDTQLFEARAAGASAALLIARALPDDRLAALAATARAVGLEPLVEVRDEAELASALAAGAQVIGVNNRDLETLIIDPAVGARVVAQIPRDRVAVYESGVADRAGVEAAARAGADAVLVGSVLSTAADGAAAVRQLVGVPVRREGRRG